MGGEGGNKSNPGYLKRYMSEFQSTAFGPYHDAIVGANTQLEQLLSLINSGNSRAKNGSIYTYTYIYIYIYTSISVNSFWSLP